MHYVICYDITSDRTRLKTARILEDYGDRVQGSVFELPGVDNLLFLRCLKRLRKLKLKDNDSIRIYPLDEAAKNRILILGRGEAMSDEDVYIV